MRVDVRVRIDQNNGIELIEQTFAQSFRHSIPTRKNGEYGEPRYSTCIANGGIERRAALIGERLQVADGSPRLHRSPSGDVIPPAREFHAQILTQRPRLKRATTRRERRLCIGNFRNVPEPRGVQMLFKRRQKLLRRLSFHFRRAAANANPRFDKRAHEPRPNGSLMIRRIALRRPANALPRIVRRTRRKRSQTERREQPCFDCIDNTLRALAMQQRQRQSADGENLIRPLRFIDRAGLDDPHRPRRTNSRARGFQNRRSNSARPFSNAAVQRRSIRLAIHSAFNHSA